MTRSLALTFLVISSSASAQFTSGNLAVYRVGDGSAALNTSATTTFVEQFNTTGIGQSPINTVTIATTGVNRLVNSGSATSEGFLVRSTDGLLLTFGGYDAALGTTAIAATSAATNRVGGIIDGNGIQTVLSSNFGGNFNNGNIRSVVMDAGRAWGVGSNTGVVSNVGGTNTIVSTTPSNLRVVNVLSDQLYFSTGSGTQGIYRVGTGTPTGAGETSTLVISTVGIGTGTASPYGFQANTTGDVVYIADDRVAASGGGVQKWTWNGSAWVHAYTLATGNGARGLSVDWSNPSAPVVYATTTESSANRLIRINDTGAGSAFTNLATAGVNTAFRGVDQTLLPATWTSSVNGDFVNSNTSTSGFSNAFSNWSVGLADGINLAFQKVNAATVAVNNNSTLTSVSSIQFTGTGSPTLLTQYAINGNSMVLNGTTATGFGVTNNSGVTQTINLDLALATPQTFNAASGALAFGGAVSLGANALTVTGASNTTISGNLSGTGGLTKTGTGTLTLSGNNSGFSGISTVAQGTLAVSDGNAPGTGSYTIVSQGRLQSTATFAEIVVDSGGTVAPGASPGTLNSALATWNGGGTFEFEINDATGTAGVNNDLWNITTNNGFTINATAGDQFIINIPDPQTVANFDPLTSYSWQFASFVGSIQGAGFDPNAFSVVFGGPFTGNGTFNVSSAGGGLLLNFTPSPVPEPTTLMLVGLAGGVWLIARRRSLRLSAPSAE